MIELLLAGLGLGLDIFGRKQEYKEAAKRAEWEAQERLYETSQLRSEASARAAMASEQGHQLARAKSYARGSARALQAKAGIAPSGSAKTMLDSISSDFRNKQKMLELQYGYESIRTEGQLRSKKREYYELMRQKKSAERASKWGGMKSLFGSVPGTVFDLF